MQISQNEIKNCFKSFLNKVDEGVSHPTLYIISGGNGSGKTTLRKQLFKEQLLPKNALHHDPDSVMVQLTGYLEDIGDTPSTETLQQAFKSWEVPARILSEEILQKAIEQKSHIIYERSCGMADSLNFLQSMKDLGYQLNYFMVHTDLDIALQRAQRRTEIEGRFTPPEIIKKRAAALQKLCPQYIKMSSSARIYDNTYDHPELIFEKHEKSPAIIHNQTRHNEILGAL